MLRNEPCLTTSLYQESAKIGQAFPQEQLLAPTTWWKPGPTLSPAILPNDVVPIYKKTYSWVGRVKYFSKAHSLPFFRGAREGHFLLKGDKNTKPKRNLGSPLLFLSFADAPAPLWLSRHIDVVSICPKPECCRGFPAMSTAFAAWRWMCGVGHISPFLFRLRTVGKVASI